MRKIKRARRKSVAPLGLGKCRSARKCRLRLGKCRGRCPLERAELSLLMRLRRGRQSARLRRLEGRRWCGEGETQRNNISLNLGPGAEGALLKRRRRAIGNSIFNSAPRSALSSEATLAEALCADTCRAPKGRHFRALYERDTSGGIAAATFFCFFFI